MKPETHIYTIVAKKQGYQDAYVRFPNDYTVQAIPSKVHILLKLINTVYPTAPSRAPAAGPGPGSLDQPQPMTYQHI